MVTTDWKSEDSQKQNSQRRKFATWLTDKTISAQPYWNSLSSHLSFSIIKV